jgi:hypothetical protein
MKTVTTISSSWLVDLTDMYLQAAGQWTGCDWPTDFGLGHLNLEGLKASQALLLARATAGKEAADWRAAYRWLTTIEQEARQAELEAGGAFALAPSGQLREALHHARKAYVLEVQYHSQPIWQPLLEAVEQAVAVMMERS